MADYLPNVLSNFTDSGQYTGPVDPARVETEMLLDAIRQAEEYEYISDRQARKFRKQLEDRLGNIKNGRILENAGYMSKGNAWESLGEFLVGDPKNRVPLREALGMDETNYTLPKIDFTGEQAEQVPRPPVQGPIQESEGVLSNFNDEGQFTGFGEIRNKKLTDDRIEQLRNATNQVPLESDVLSNFNEDGDFTGFGELRNRKLTRARENELINRMLNERVPVESTTEAGLSRNPFDVRKADIQPEQTQAGLARNPFDTMKSEIKAVPVEAPSVPHSTKEAETQQTVQERKPESKFNLGQSILDVLRGAGSGVGKTKAEAFLEGFQGVEKVIADRAAAKSASERALRDEQRIDRRESRADARLAHDIRDSDRKFELDAAMKEIDSLKVEAEIKKLRGEGMGDGKILDYVKLASRNVQAMIENDPRLRNLSEEELTELYATQFRAITRTANRVPMAGV